MNLWVLSAFVTWLKRAVLRLLWWAIGDLLNLKDQCQLYKLSRALSFIFILFFTLALAISVSENGSRLATINTFIVRRVFGWLTRKVQLLRLEGVLLCEYVFGLSDADRTGRANEQHCFHERLCRTNRAPALKAPPILLKFTDTNTSDLLESNTACMRVVLISEQSLAALKSV